MGALEVIVEKNGEVRSVSKQKTESVEEEPNCIWTDAEGGEERRLGHADHVGALNRKSPHHHNLRPSTNWRNISIRLLRGSGCVPH
jgi:hypothetical protein